MSDRIVPGSGYQTIVAFCEEASLADARKGTYNLAIHVNQTIPGFLQPIPLAREMYRSDTKPIVSMNDFIESRYHLTECIERALGRGTLTVKVAILEALLWRHTKHLHLIRRRILGMLEHFPNLQIGIIPNQAGWYRGNEVSWYYMCTPQDDRQLSVGQTDVPSITRQDYTCMNPDIVQQFEKAFEDIWRLCIKKTTLAMIKQLPTT